MDSTSLLHAYAFAVYPARLIVPAACACCGDVAASSAREIRGSDGASIIVPYCSECHFHVSAERTRALGGAMSSALVGLTLAAALPLVWSLSPLGYVAMVASAAALPLALVSVLSQPHRTGHAAPARAVFWLRDGRLACVNASWARALADANGCPYESLRLRSPRWNRWMWLGPAVVFLSIPLFFPAYFARVRIVNLTNGRLSIRCSGRTVAVLEPTSQESPGAGVEVRLPTGTQKLIAEDVAGRIIDDRTVTVEGRVAHLYAPGSDDYCFWLERTPYGRRAASDAGTIEPLPTATRFWALAAPIDTWFAPNPTTAHDARSSGGRLVALRQSACADAPPAVRKSPRATVGSSPLPAAASTGLQGASSDYSKAP